jgi:hypothetical protein
VGEWKACQQEKYRFFFAFSLQNSDFLYSVVNYSDFAYNPNKDEIKELLQPRSPAFGRGVASAFSGQGRYAPDIYMHVSTSWFRNSVVKNIRFPSEAHHVTKK